MRIVYIGQGFGTSLHRMRAIERIGHKVKLVDPWSWLGQTPWMTRWLHHLGGIGVFF
jgi:hypothetical protein